MLKSLETARQEKVIGAPLEARSTSRPMRRLYPLLEDYAGELPGLFIVSKVILSRQTDAGVSVKIGRAPGTKCERCWKYTEDVGSDAELPDCVRGVRRKPCGRSLGVLWAVVRAFSRVAAAADCDWSFRCGPLVQMDD